MKLSIRIIPVAVFFTAAAGAQVDLPPAFRQKLEAARIDFMEPLESGYKDIRVEENDLVDYDFAIRSRKEKMEIRYLIEPSGSGQALASIPHVQCIRVLSTLATNDERYVMSGIDVGAGDLTRRFNADWGKVFFFKPKEGFSAYQNCKMLALFREGQGMAYVFFLFDEAGPELDYRFYALSFRGEKQ